MRASLLILVVLTFSACGRAAEAIPGRTAQLDTLAGFKLGMLLPDARTISVRRGDAFFECEAVTDTTAPLGTVSCHGVTFDSVDYHRRKKEVHDPNGPYVPSPPGYKDDYSLTFGAGSLTTVVSLLGPDWKTVPAMAIAARLRDAGYSAWDTVEVQPSARAGFADTTIVWRSKENYAALFCFRSEFGDGARSCNQVSGMRDTAQ